MARSRIATVALVILGLSAPAFANNQSWNITEVDPDNGAQGQWLVSIDGDKLSGSTNMQFDTGAMLSYTLDGSLTGGALNVNMRDRSDGKKGCVFSGRIQLNDDKTSHRVVGEVQCAEQRFLVRGGY